MSTKQIFWQLALIFLFASKANADCLVSITQGSVRGSELTSYQGKNFCSFRGIPYAAPPVGDLRFKAPEPPEPWTGELDGTKDGNQCIQGLETFYLGHEDCLFLNVHTPQTSDSVKDLLPVMVFIHGGAFILGNGNMNNYGPLYLIDKDVIMVSLNYRLGLMGFLSTNDDESPGNYALKDQAQALVWVQNNIAAFGGDPNKVTIMGESAGSMSVHFHVLSPLSKGLFHNAIGDSGSAIMPIFSHSSNALALAQHQGEAVGCSTDSTTELMSCLRKVDIETLMTHQWSDCSVLTNIACLYNIPWRPVVEVQTTANPKPFLTASPEDVIKSGDFNKVPFLLGTNGAEGALFMLPYIGTQDVMDKMNSDLDSLGKSGFFLGESVSESDIPTVMDSILDFFLGSNHTVTPDNVNKLIDAATDRFMQHNVQKSVELHLKAGHDTIYLYNFDYKGKYTFLLGARYGDNIYDLGVLHVDELQYYLSYGKSPDKWEAGHPDLEVLDAVVTLWTNMAIYGNPTPPEQDAPQGVTWPTAGSNDSHITYYVFENDKSKAGDIKPLHISIQPDKFKERMDFWDSLPLLENQD